MRPKTARTATADLTPRLKMGMLALGVLGAVIAGSALQAEQHGETFVNDAGETVIRTHGYNYYGDLEYPADYKHFRYVNPEAPKGGVFVIDASGTFDSMNPYARKGRAGAQSSMMYETLLDGGAPADEYASSYCLLCESLEYDEGQTWVIFNLRPEARFSDGTPLTAHDVVFSHKLSLEQGLPSYANAVKQRVIGAEALDDHRVKFTFAPDIPRRSLISQVGATSVWSKAWFEETGARLDEPRMETSPGSGPYVLDSYDINRRITYKRNPDYWGKDLPINVGRHNFDEIRIEYFSDETAAFEAFKAGEYTFRNEVNSKQWATGYDFPGVEKGWVVLEEIPDGNPPSNVGFVFNLDREKFADKRVREALALGYNFEWSNESLQYGLFSQRESFFQDTVQHARGLPEGAELELLKSLGDIVPEAMITEPPRMPHTSSPTRVVDRRNLRQAMKLLDEAGFAVGSDGMRRDAQGNTLDIEIPINSAGSPTMESLIGTYVQNLQQMGVNAVMQKVDPSQYTLRRRERDYDMIFDGYRTFIGAGTGLMQLYGSEQAAVSVFNPAGIASPLIDTLIERALFAETTEEETTALTALDRALRHEFFVVPAYYKSDNWLAYFNMYEHPEDMPPFAVGEQDFWWVNPEKAAALKAAGALR